REVEGRRPLEFTHVCLDELDAQPGQLSPLARSVEEKARAIDCGDPQAASSQRECVATRATAQIERRRVGRLGKPGELQGLGDLLLADADPLLWEQHRVNLAPQ